MIDIQLLEHALILATVGNFTRAAKELGVSQPTLSRNMQKLERHLGSSVFVRSKNMVVPTPAGEKFLKQAKMVLFELNKLEMQAAEEQGTVTGEITLGVGTYPEELFLADILARVSKELPLVHVKVITCSWFEFVNELYDRTMDFFIGEKSLMGRERILETIPLRSKDYGGFFCRSGHPLLQAKKIQLNDVFHYPYVGILQVPRIADKFPASSRFGDIEGNTFRPRISCISFALQKKVIAASDCIGIGNEGSIKSEIDQGILAMVPIDVPSIHSDYGITYLKKRELSQLDQRLIDIILDVDKTRFESGCR